MGRDDVFTCFVLTSVFALTFLFVIQVVSATQTTHHQATEATIMWDPVTTLIDGSDLPEGSLMRYEVAVRQSGESPISLTQTPIEATQYTITLPSPGYWEAGVRAVMFSSDELLMGESFWAWSTDPESVPEDVGPWDVYRLFALGNISGFQPSTQ